MMVTIIGIVLTVALSTTLVTAVYKDTVYEARSITESDVTVHVHSEITGNITWVFTNEATLTIMLRLSGGSFEDINNTDVICNSNTSTIILIIGEQRSEHIAAVTGTGNRNGHVIILLWLTAVLLDWKHLHLVLLIGVANGISHSLAAGKQTNIDAEEKFVDIQIRAPRRLRYEDVNLFANGGTLRVLGQTTSDKMDSMCRTERVLAGCDSCCHGNGICVRNLCACDYGFDSKYSCRSKPGRNVLYSHPLDPHLSRTILPNGDIISLNDVINSKSTVISANIQDGFYIDLNMKDMDNTNSKILFYNNGFIKDIIGSIENNTFLIKLRRSRLSNCVVNVRVIIGGDYNLRLENDVKVCNETGQNAISNIKSDRVRKSNKNKHQRRFRSNSTRHESRRKRKRFNGDNIKGGFIDIPVRVERCGEDFIHDVSVSFELVPKSNTPQHADAEFVQSNESISMHSYWNDTNMRLFYVYQTWINH